MWDTIRFFTSNLRNLINLHWYPCIIQLLTKNTLSVGGLRSVECGKNGNEILVEMEIYLSNLIYGFYLWCQERSEVCWWMSRLLFLIIYEPADFDVILSISFLFVNFRRYLQKLSNTILQLAKNLRNLQNQPPLCIFSGHNRGHILNLLWHMFRSNTDKKCNQCRLSAFTSTCCVLCRVEPPSNLFCAYLNNKFVCKSCHTRNSSQLRSINTKIGKCFLLFYRRCRPIRPWMTPSWIQKFGI